MEKWHRKEHIVIIIIIVLIDRCPIVYINAHKKKCILLLVYLVVCLIDQMKIPSQQSLQEFHEW